MNERHDMTGADYWESLIKRSVSRYFLLCMLYRRPMHGYDIAKSIETCCEGWSRPTDGMIYPTIKELLAEGYIECHTEIVSGRSRKVCHLTPKGEQAVRTGAGVWAQVLPFLQECVRQGGVNVPGEVGAAQAKCDDALCGSCQEMDLGLAASQSGALEE